MVIIASSCQVYPEHFIVFSDWFLPLIEEIRLRCRNQSFTEWFISNSLRFYGEPYKDLADLTYAEYIRDTKLSFQIGLQ